MSGCFISFDCLACHAGTGCPHPTTQLTTLRARVAELEKERAMWVTGVLEKKHAESRASAAEQDRDEICRTWALMEEHYCSARDLLCRIHSAMYAGPTAASYGPAIDSVLSEAWQLCFGVPSSQVTQAVCSHGQRLVATESRVKRMEGALRALIDDYRRDCPFPSGAAVAAALVLSENPAALAASDSEVPAREGGR